MSCKNAHKKETKIFPKSPLKTISTRKSLLTLSISSHCKALWNVWKEMVIRISLLNSKIKCVLKNTSSGDWVLLNTSYFTSMSTGSSSKMKFPSSIMRILTEQRLMSLSHVGRLTFVKDMVLMSKEVKGYLYLNIQSSLKSIVYITHTNLNFILVITCFL